MKFSVVLLIAISILASPVGLVAFETDQYNLSPVPLADIGDEVSEYVEADLRTAVAKVNSEIDKHLRCLETKVKGCGSAAVERKRLNFLRSNNGLAEAVYERLGKGNLFTTKFGNWIRSHKFRGQPDRYKTSYAESIYILNPADYLTISATVRLHGAEFGIDKLEHFFQQGYKYHKIRTESAAKGASETEAVAKAVKWGQFSERTYFGLWVSGVYSNADLYANFAGMKFYQGLADPLQINGKLRPATVKLKDGSWQIDNEALRENLLKPFLTDHLNEALNPSSFRPTLVRSVRRAVKKYACPEWLRTYPGLSADALTEKSRVLELWSGEDYGFNKKGRTAKIEDICFDD